jgi:hypothetical protein
MAKQQTKLVATELRNDEHREMKAEAAYQDKSLRQALAEAAREWTRRAKSLRMGQ